MKNQELLLQRINEGIEYIQEQSLKLAPILSFLEQQMLLKKEELSAKDIFDYYVKLQELKVNSLLVECKMKEILEFKD